MKLLKEVWNMSEANLIKRAGFNPPADYNIGASLRNAFEEFHPTKGEGTLDNYARNILNSEAPDEIKKQSVVLLDSIRSKSDDFKTLLKDFNFDDKSDLATTMFNIVDGDTDPNEEDTLRFYDFNIDMSTDSGMWDNVIGLLDELNTFFDIITGMLADPTLSKQHEPTPVGFSFQSKKPSDDKSYEHPHDMPPIDKGLSERFKKLANILK